MTPKKLARILYQRGIEGVVLTLYEERFEVPLKNLAAVSLEGDVHAPALPRILTDIDFNLFEAFRNLIRLGYRRIGICLAKEIPANPAHFTLEPLIRHLVSTIPASQRIVPLFYDWFGIQVSEKSHRAAVRWLKKWCPDAVICHANLMVEWCREAGLRVPEETGVVHLATDDDVPDWAGICSNRRVIGATAIEWVVSRIIHRDFGVPKCAPTLLVPGVWHPGRTLRE